MHKKKYECNIVLKRSVETAWGWQSWVETCCSDKRLYCYVCCVSIYLV